MDKILFVDDDDGIRFLFADILSDEGYKVITADTGFELLEKIYIEKPDLVILDIKMVHHTGLDLLIDIRNVYHFLPIIIFTAFQNFKEDMRTIAADFYVIKGINTTELINKIKLALDSQLPREINSSNPKSKYSRSETIKIIDKHIEYIIINKLNFKYLSSRKIEYKSDIEKQIDTVLRELDHLNLLSRDIDHSEINKIIYHKFNIFKREANRSLNLILANIPDKGSLPESELEDLFSSYRDWEIITFEKFCELSFEYINAAKANEVFFDNRL